MFIHPFGRSATKRSARRLVLFSCFVSLAFLVYFLHSAHPPSFSSSFLRSHLADTELETELRHVVFGIASSAGIWEARSGYARSWWLPGQARGFVWLDENASLEFRDDPSLPSLRVSEETSGRFPYSNLKGLPSAVRVARIVTETVRLGLPDVRWFVFGDDDTVFFADNLVGVLRKYDHKSWFYVGEASENVDQNRANSFEMGFGGGGFALSYPLAVALERVLDLCLVRYAHLYGSDARIFACLAELGIGLTHERGFHQVDIRGNAFGLLAGHPLAPLVSLHHLDKLDPIFPNLDRMQAVEHLFKAVKADPRRILQQTVCYEKSMAWTVLVSWGYSIQVYDRIQLITDLLPLWRTFMPWRRGEKNVSSVYYMFNTKELPRDPCKRRHATFFLENVAAGPTGTESNYSGKAMANCRLSKISPWDLENINVESPKLDFDLKQLQAPRRQCCDIVSLGNKEMKIVIRKCEDGEVIFLES